MLIVIEAVVNSFALLGYWVRTQERYLVPSMVDKVMADSWRGGLPLSETHHVRGSCGTAEPDAQLQHPRSCPAALIARGIISQPCTPSSLPNQVCELVISQIITPTAHSLCTEGVWDGGDWIRSRDCDDRSKPRQQPRDNCCCDKSKADGMVDLAHASEGPAGTLQSIAPVVSFNWSSAPSSC